MGKVYMTGGSGSGTASDELTATAGDVLQGKLYMGKDTDDESGTGTLALTGSAGVEDVLASKTFYATDPKNQLTGTIESKAAETYYATSADQRITAGQYLSGEQKISKLTETGIDPANIKTGVKVSVNNGQDDVFTATGTYTGDATLANANQLRNGVIGYGKGVRYAGNMPEMTGQAYTPTAARQTVSCANKYMTSDIIINPIPSTWVNPSDGGAFFSNGSYGPMADLGAYAFPQSSNSGSYLTPAVLTGGISIPTGYNNNYNNILFKRGMSLATLRKWKRIVFTYIPTKSGNYIGIYISLISYQTDRKLVYSGPSVVSKLLSSSPINSEKTAELEIPTDLSAYQEPFSLRLYCTQTAWESDSYFTGELGIKFVSLYAYAN